MQTLDEILEAVERVNPRLDLLKNGYNAIYIDEAISNQCILHQPDGKCYFIQSNREQRKNEILRELTAEEYAKIDLIKGRDY
ncbi:hypothetical protein [Helicobacter sp. 13S00477-4]|uniref:hypothetical protein n=1 Tax=Helicobacter sp. 13S00477-4 TaxID=1905759 RepID=UPI000BA5578A|nr:hypothetical protein [Helicobacter sp. 13S00477-4]PAF50228.1 hypothetical protein BKH44_08560 [Helicobacter sp. 13S00477-4]